MTAPDTVALLRILAADMAPLFAAAAVCCAVMFCGWILEVWRQR